MSAKQTNIICHAEDFSPDISRIHTLKYANIISLAFPADIDRKTASPARGSRQRLHAGESRLCFAGNNYTPANEAQHGGARKDREVRK